MSRFPKYPLEDELLSVRSPGLQREIEADLKTLDELNFDSFLEEADSLAHSEENTSDKQIDADSSNSVDEDDFFLENEENKRKNSSPMPSGPLLQKCFKTVLGMGVVQSIVLPSSRKASLPEAPLTSSDSEDSDDCSIDEIFEGFLDDELKTKDSLDKASLVEPLPVKRKIPTLSCPFVTIGCTYQSDQPNAIAQHIKKMHKQLDVPKECCGSEFETQMDYYNHTKNDHSI